MSATGFSVLFLPEDAGLEWMTMLDPLSCNQEVYSIRRKRIVFEAFEEAGTL